MASCIFCNDEPFPKGRTCPFCGPDAVGRSTTGEVREAGAPSEALIDPDSMTSAAGGLGTKPLAQHERQQLEAAASRATWWCVLCVSGAAIAVMVSLVTYADAADNPQGGTYYVWWGPVALGLWAAFRNGVKATKIRSFLRASSPARFAGVMAAPSPAPAIAPARTPARTPAPAGPSVADELLKLGALRDSGLLTEDEFQAQKKRLLT